jgi:hypothetical protein
MYFHPDASQVGNHLDALHCRALLPFGCQAQASRVVACDPNQKIGSAQLAPCSAVLQRVTESHMACTARSATTAKQGGWPWPGMQWLWSSCADGACHGELSPRSYIWCSMWCHQSPLRNMYAANTYSCTVAVCTCVPAPGLQVPWNAAGSDLYWQQYNLRRLPVSTINKSLCMETSVFVVRVWNGLRGTHWITCQRKFGPPGR